MGRAPGFVIDGTSVSGHRSLDLEAQLPCRRGADQQIGRCRLRPHTRVKPFVESHHAERRKELRAGSGALLLEGHRVPHTGGARWPYRDVRRGYRAAWVRFRSSVKAEPESLGGGYCGGP
ncbi:hypothetical protein Asi02nite_30800 [Asanoa siamensis]|uniref:Uncharacterized protein n=1 Tax=Asanoa siamensis TaxID=926357 RepID=A0ABQ4CQK3_9ACTN|nr:hypothetical protein Asi02nite_30800 [Asanoa siamensis]